MSMQGLKISGNGRFLTTTDGTPFFWLGDTAWNLLHKLDRDEAEHYLRYRAEQQFNVIQTVILSEADGLRTGNAYGRKPLKQNERGEYDPLLPDTEGDYSYWDHIDFVLDTAASLGLYVALLPTWGDKFHLKGGKGPVIFHEQNARAYGHWLGKRYKNRPNLIWVLGGDRPLVRYEHFAVIREMAEGIKAGDDGRHLMTFHPQGWQSSSHHVHEESWLDFNMIQSGHGQRELVNYEFVNADYGRSPVKPTLDAEPCYEDIPVGFKPENGYFDAADVRTAAYYAVLSGAFGHTYGQHSIWSMTRGTDDDFVMTWQEGLHRPGAAQMRHLRALMESRPLPERVPDQSLVANNRPGANYMTAARGREYAFVYTPNGLPVEVTMGKIAGSRAAASWFDPRTGEFREIGEYPNSGTAFFRPPSAGRGNDWVLVLDTMDG